MRFQRQRIVLLRAISEGAEYKQHEISRRKILEKFVLHKYIRHPKKVSIL